MYILIAARQNPKGFKVSPVARDHHEPAASLIEVTQERRELDHSSCGHYCILTRLYQMHTSISDSNIDLDGELIRVPVSVCGVLLTPALARVSMLCVRIIYCTSIPPTKRIPRDQQI